MDEATWTTCDEPEPMLHYLQGKASERKLRLVAVACCRRIWDFMADVRSQQAVVASEMLADGLLGHAERQIATTNADRAIHDVDDAYVAPEMAALSAISIDVTVHVPASLACSAQTAHEQGLSPWPSLPERKSQCDLIRDINGNPFRPVTIDPSWLMWRESTVPRLAQAVYEDRDTRSGNLDTTRLAILGDALEEAGCVDREILEHLRSAGPHVRGCWVVDAILNKA
jgi:hypothetical protein